GPSRGAAATGGTAGARKVPSTFWHQGNVGGPQRPLSNQWAILGKCLDDIASNLRAPSITRWPVRACPRLADELQQIWHASSWEPSREGAPGELKRASGFPFPL